MIFAFVARCYILHCDSDFYFHMGQEYPYNSLEKTLHIVKYEGEFIIMGDMNGHAR